MLQDFRWGCANWNPASILSLDISMRPVGSDTGGLHMPSVHYIVPETAVTTHYFAAIGRNVNIHHRHEDSRIINIALRAFTEEDEPMIRACQQLMGATDLMSLRPAILKTDSAAMQARRILDLD